MFRFGWGEHCLTCLLCFLVRILSFLCVFIPLKQNAVNLSAYLLIARAPNSLKPSQRSVSISIALVAFSAVVFRAELAALAAALALQSIYLGHITFWRALTVGAVSSLASIGASSRISLTPDLTLSSIDAFGGLVLLGAALPMAGMAQHLLQHRGRKERGLGGALSRVILGDFPVNYLHRHLQPTHT